MSAISSSEQAPMQSVADVKQHPFEQKVPMQVVEALQRSLGERFIALVLLGSQARGEAHEASDWDMLVIAQDLPEGFFPRYLFLKQLLPPDCGTVSLLARTPEEFEDHLPSLFLDIALDGVIFYDPHGYAADRLAFLRRLMAEAGLYRQRTEAGDVWRWEREPSGPGTLEWRKKPCM